MRCPNEGDGAVQACAELAAPETNVCLGSHGLLRALVLFGHFRHDDPLPILITLVKPIPIDDSLA
jgi:hypothetical protein